MRETLEEVLDDELRQAKILKDNDHDHDATLIKRICKRVSDATEDYLVFLSEKEASLWSAKSPDWLRARFPRWESRGHAKKLGRLRSYRRIVLEPRVDPARVRADAQATARLQSKPKLNTTC